MKQKGRVCRDQGDKGGFSYGKRRGRQLIHQWWNIKEFSRKTGSFLQIQLLPSWYLGSAHSQTAGTEIRGDIRIVTGAGQPPHGKTELSYAGGGWDYGTVEIQRGPGDSKKSIDHHKTLSWSAATILWQDGRTAPAALLSTAEGPGLGIGVCSFKEE